MENIIVAGQAVKLAQPLAGFTAGQELLTQKENEENLSKVVAIGTPKHR